MSKASKIKVLFCSSDQPQEYNCSWYRCLSPYRALRKAGYESDIIPAEDWVNRTPDAMERTKKADLVIFQRNVFGPTLETIMYWKAQGKAVAIDLDDAYQHMTADTGTPSFDFWHHGYIERDGKKQEVTPHPIDSLKWGIKIAGAVTSPSQLIVDDWAYLAKGYLLPNYMEPSMYKRYEARREPGMLYIGWGGSMTHLKSFRDSNITMALLRILSERKNVRIALAGDDRVLSVVKLPASKVVKLGFTNIVLWPRFLSMFDIGIAPLAGEYDRRRSFLKGMEYGLMQIPWVGSDLEPYKSLAEYGTLVDNTKESWYNALVDIVDNIERYREKSFNDYNAILKYDINRNVPGLVKTYEKIVEDSK